MAKQISKKLLKFFSPCYFVPQNWDFTAGVDWDFAQPSSLLEGARRAEQVGKQRIEKILADAKANPGDPRSDWAGDDAYDQEMNNQLMNSILLACVSVAIASQAETCLTSLCKVLGVTLRAKATLGSKYEELCSVFGEETIEGLKGHASLKVVVALANSFKHRDGLLNLDTKCKFDEYWEKAFGTEHVYQVDDRIKYEQVDYKSLVRKTANFCKQLHDLTVDRIEAA